MSRTAALALLLAACSSGDPGFRRPQFAEPQNGVWNRPLPVVAGTDDEMMPDVAASGWLVYSAKTNGNVDIFRRPFSGGSAERLTEHSADDTDPVFSPDGRRIAFTSQSSDVKGDIFVMDADGSDQEQLTDRNSVDSAPCWAPSGEAIYFASSSLGERPNVERIDLERGTRTVIAEDAWDPAVHPDGSVLFFAGLDGRNRTRIFALRLSDGMRLPLTDGAYPEAFPRVRVRGDDVEVLFVRFTDDDNRDRRLDGNDTASLWSARFSPDRFEGGPPARATPLTSGAGAELFVSAAADTLVYTTAGFGDLEIYVLPEEGVIASEATHEAILEAASSEDNPNLRRLGLRYLVVNAPELEGPAHYQLARELAERGFRREAIEELERAAEVYGADPMAEVSRVEIARLRMLNAMDGRWLARERRERIQVEEQQRVLESVNSSEPSVRARVTVTTAESRLALGQRARAIADLEDIADDDTAPSEDRARALDRLADAYGRLGDPTTVIRLCERLLRNLVGERYYARRCAERWVASASQPVGVPARGVDRETNSLGVSVRSTLEEIATEYADIPMLAARAQAELANRQSESGFEEEARAAWRVIVERFPREREVLRTALTNLASAAEARGELDLALEGYEQLGARFSDDPATRARARRGVSRIALIRAQREESKGNREAALKDYRRILENDRELTVAHRRYIRLSAELGRLEQVRDEYRRAAKDNPRDKLARYGLGYALTFGADPEIYAAEAELQAALEIDPRLAPAHLTLGWVRMQRERKEPREGWAERAAGSFKVAEELADRTTEGRLYAAARLNSGNALYALNKLDDAFLAYLDRELDRTPFDDDTTELIFRERFARTALREDHLDVALDQANLAHRLLMRQPGQPRRASIEALIGSVYFLAESYQRAVPWLSGAQERFESSKDWDRAVPLLRTLSVTHLRIGDLRRAREYIDHIRELIQSGRAPADPARPVFENFEFLIWSEAPAKVDDVTLAPYGFSKELELQLANALAARTRIADGQLDDAMALMESRIELLRAFYERGVVGARARPEWIVALNEAAGVAARIGDRAKASAYLLQALTAARTAGSPRAVIQLAESLVRLWAEDANVGSDAELETTWLALETVQREADPDEAQRAARVAGLLALMRFDRARATLSEPHTAREAETEPLRERLSRLDRVAASANRVERLAAQYRVETLRDQVPPGPYQNADARIEAAAPAPAASPVAETDDAGEGKPVDDEAEKAESGSDPAATATAVSETAAAAEDDTAASSGEATSASEGLLRASFARRTAQWRIDYDHSTTAENAGPLLDAAIEAFLSDPVPSGARELPRFLAAAEARALERDDPELAWRVLEHARLLALQPSRDRRARGKYPASWIRLIETRGTADYAPDKASALIRALEGLPATHDALRKVLGEDSALLQVFAVGDRWAWYGLDATRFQRFDAEADGERLPAAVIDWLDAAAALRTVYVDGGENELAPARHLRIGDATLGNRYEVSEILSATYLLASYEARNLSRASAARYGHGGLTSIKALPTNVSLLSLAGTVRGFGATRRPGERQVVLEAAGAEPLDLDALASRELSPQAIVFANVGRRGDARLLAHAALIAGSPSALTVRGPIDGLDARIASTLDEQRIATVVPSLSLDEREARLWGYRGMNLEERVRFAYSETLAIARRAGPLYRDATRSNERELYLEASRALEETVRLVEYLLVPDHLEAFRSTDVGAARADSLPRFSLIFRGQLAVVLSGLGDLERASTLRRELIRQYEESGAQKDALEQLLLLGKTLNDGQELEQAREAFSRCIELAAQQKEVLIEADCRSRLGSVHRSLYNYEAAQESYEAAIALYAREDHPNQLAPARYLGFLYESSLNDYDAALVQFEFALEAAKRFESENDEIPGLFLDIARIQRLRGEYARALESVDEARQWVSSSEVEQLTAVNLESAKIYWYRGDYRRARQAQNQALEQSVRSGNTFSRIQSLSVGGLIAMNQGELDEAESLIREALDLSRITARKSEEAAQLNNLGVVLQRAGRVDEAIAAYRNALVIDETLGSREGRAFDLRNLGTAYGRQGDYDRALEALDEALRLSQELGIKFNEAESLFRRGEVLEGMERDAEAGAMFEAAADLATRVALPELQWRSLYALGRLEEDRGQDRAARAYYSRSLDVAERLGRSRDESTRGATRDDLYEDAVRLAVAAEDLEGVFELLERRRSRARLDAFANRTVTLANSEAQTLLRRETRARDRVYAAERDVARDKAGSRERLAAAEREYAERRQELADRFPRIARTFTSETVTLDTLRAALPERTLVLSFLIGSRRSYAMVVTREGARWVRLEARRDELKPLLTELRRGMRAFAPLEGPLGALGGVLLTPIQDALEDADRLVVIPDAVLGDVPFAALRVGEQSVVDRWAVTEVSSASALVDLLRASPARAKNVAAFAYGADLPFAALEARAVSASPWIAADATIPRLRASRADAWALAVHGRLDSRDPLGSALELAPAADEDGLLYAHEVFALPRVPALVTLSGCETALREAGGIPRLSLADSFLTTGAQTVVATHHRVSDFAAALVMKWFYRFQGRAPADEALRRAMLRVRSDHAHPAHWASFSLIGDFR